MIKSMTGFASVQGEIPQFSWQIEISGVNHRGLDIKLRAPDWIDGLARSAREYLQKQVARGALYVTINVRNEMQKIVNSNPEPHAIQRSLEAIQLVEDQAKELGVILAPSKASDVLLAVFGKEEKSSYVTNTAALKSALMADFTNVVDTFIEARRDEGNALKEVLLDQAAQINTILKSTGVVLQTREINLKKNFQTHLKLLIGSAANVDPQRMAQELATMMIKIDVTEEVDRLQVHVKSFHDVLSEGGVVGRKLEFLMQEFHREANTLCSKSQNSDLTTIGVELKVIIDQMREQVQNLE